MHRFHLLDNRKTEAFGTSFENVSDKYTWKMREQIAEAVPDRTKRSTWNDNKEPVEMVKAKKDAQDKMPNSSTHKMT